MNLEKTIKQYFTRESVVDILTQYELYYQISLGNYIYETIQDIDETNNKIAELNLFVDPNIALANTFEEILRYSHLPDFEDKFHYYLRKRALMHALKDFVNNDKELLGKEAYIEQKSQMIHNDTFFTDSMKIQLEEEYPIVNESYDMLITDEIISQLQSNLSEGLITTNYH